MANTKNMQNSIFDAISVVAEAKVRSYKADLTVECTITDVSHSSDGRYRVAYTGSEFDAYGAANSYYAGDVVYVTVPQGDFTKLKIIIGRKVDPDSLPSTTFNFKMPFDDFIALRNLTGEAPVTWSGQSVGFTANKEGRYITQTDYAQVQAGTVNIDECKSCVYIKSAHRWEDADGNTLTEDQVKYIAGDGEEIAINKDYVNKLKDILAALNTLAQNYSKKLQTLLNNHKNLITLIEDVNYIFKEVEDASGTHQVRDHIKVISTGEAMGSSAYTISWGGLQMNYLRAIQSAITTDFSIAPNKMDWITKADASTALWTKIRDLILLPYMRAFIAGLYTKQVEEIDNNTDLTDEEKKARKAILVNADNNSSYEKLLPYFAWDSVDLEGIENTIQGRYDVISKYLENEFYTGMVNGVQVTYTDPYYRSLYPATVSGYASASATYNDELNLLNAENRNLLWTWQGKKSKNILIETKLGISIDMTSLLGSWEPTSGQYGLRFVISGVTKTTEDDASQAIEETITFTNNDMYGNTYAYYTPYTQLKIFDISHLLTLDRIDCYFWQDFDFRDWGGVLIPPTYETVDELGEIVNKFIDPNLLVSNLKVLVGLTADEATTDRILIYTYDDTAFGLSQLMQADLGTQGVERWKAGEQVRTEDPKSNDAAKTILIAWIHIDELDGPILINHETMRHAADKQALLYWRAKVYWYKFDWEYDLNNGIEADRMGGQSWRPLDLNPAVLYPSTNSDNVIVKSWHEAHPDFDYTYSTENENLDILVENDFTYLNLKYRAVVVANNKPYRSEVLTFTNRDATATGGLNTKLSSVILRFLKGKVTEDGSNYVIEEDLGGGNFFIYDENNNAVTDEAGTPYSQVPYFVQIWTRNRETSDYLPASNDIHFGITDIVWKSFGNLSMIENFQEPSNADLEHSALTPITGEVTAELISWIKQITRKFYVKHRWDLARMDNTIKVNMKYLGEPFTCEHECMFGNMGTMGSEYTVVVSQEQPKNSPMILGNDFEVVARVYKRGIEQPDSSYFFGWEVLSPTWLTTPHSSNPAPRTKLFNDPSYDVHYLNDIGTFWNNSYETDSTEGYQRNVFKARILNDMPLILRCTVSHVVGYDLKVVRGFSLVNDEYFSRNLTVYCPNRVEYKSDGSAPLVDMGTFQVEKNYQQTENLDETRLFMPSDKKKKFYANASGQLLNANGQVVQKEENAAVVHDPISDDFIHPHWDLYAYTWALDGDEEYEEITDETTGDKVRRKTKVKPHGGPNPEADGSAGLMAGLSLQRTIGDGSEEEYDPAKHGDIVITESGDECLGHEFDRRIVISDGKTYVTSKYIDYKFSPVSNKTSKGAEVDGLEYPSFWSTTGCPYKGPASWHWNPAYATKYYMFITWTKDVTAPASYNPLTKTYAYHRKFWFRLAIPLTQNLYSSSLLNSWDGSLLIDEQNNAILAQMIAAGTKNKEDNTFSGVVMGDWAKKGDSSLDVPGMYGLNRGEQVFGLRINGTGYIGKSGKGRIIFDGNHGIIKNADGTCYLNLDPIIVRYKEGDLGERVSTGDIAIDNYSGTSQFFLYAETNATTDTSGTEAGNFAWAETIMRYAFGEEKHDGITQEGELVTRTNAKDIFVVDPSNGVLTTGGIYARYGRIGKYLLLNDAGISYMEGDTIDNKYFTTTYNLTNSENNNIIYIGQERRRDGTLILDTTDPVTGLVVPASRKYDNRYWSYLSYDKVYQAAHAVSGRELNNVLAEGNDYGRYIIWAGNIKPNTNKVLGAYPKFGVEHDGTVHLTEAFVQGVIHASSLVIGDEDADEWNRNQGQKNFYSKVRKDHPEDILWQNPALLKNPVAGSSLYGTNSQGMNGGTCREHYGDWLRPGDTWYISSEAIPTVSQFQGRGNGHDAANPNYENPYDLADTVVVISKYSISFNDGSGFTFLEVNKKDADGHVIKEWVNKVDSTGHVVYDADGNPVRERVNVKVKLIVYTSSLTYTIYTVETDETERKKGNFFHELTSTLDPGLNINTLEENLRANAAAVQELTEAVAAAEKKYNANKTATNLRTWNATQNQLLQLLCTYKTNNSIYDAIYSKLEAWSKNINTTSGTTLDKASYTASSLIIDKLNNQTVTELQENYPVPNADSTGSADDAITEDGLSLQMSYTQLIWEGVQDSDNNHDWYGTWTESNVLPSGAGKGLKIYDSLLHTTCANINDGLEDPGYVHPKILKKEIPSSDGKQSSPIVAKRYSAPPGWRIVGDVNNDSIWDALRHATLTFNRTLHATTRLLTTNLRQSIADIMERTGKSQREAMEEILRQRQELTNMLVHLLSDITDTVYNATADIRGGMDPITFFDDGNCYVFLTKYPIDSNVSGIGTVPAGLTIALLATQSTDNVASTFYLNSKRMGFYRTYEETLNGSNINITVPLLSYYNGTMALAGSLFFGMDYNNYIRGEGLKDSLIDANGNIKDSTIHTDDFSYTNGTITIYKNYLDGPNSRIVLGNGAIILDGEDNGKDVDGNPNSWNPGTGITGIQEPRTVNNKTVGTPYIYLGYGGVTQDNEGHTIDDKYGKGIVRIGKKNGAGLVAIADYDFASTSVTDTNLIYYYPSSDPPENILGESGELNTTALIDSEQRKTNLKKLFPNMTTGFLSSKAQYLTIITATWSKHTATYLYLGYINDMGEEKVWKLPTTPDGTGLDLSAAYYNSANDKFYHNKTLGTEDITEEYYDDQGNLKTRKIGTREVTYYDTPFYYMKNGNQKVLTYTKLSTTMGVPAGDSSSETEDEVAKLGDFTVKYSYDYLAEVTSSGSVTIKGDILTIAQHTSANKTANQLTGVGIIASDAETDGDGIIVFTPYTNANNTKWLNTGYNDANNLAHWLTGWNFKGFNVFANNMFLKKRAYIDDGAFVLEGKKYVRLASHKWTYEAIAKFMDGPITELAEQISEAFRKAQLALNTALAALAQAVVTGKIETQVGGGMYNTVTLTLTKKNGSSVVTNAGYLLSSRHSHAVKISFSGYTPIASVTGAVGSGEAGSGDLSGNGSSLQTAVKTDIETYLKDYYTKTEVDAEVKKAFKNGWEAAVAAALAAKITVSLTGGSNNASGTLTASASLVIPGNGGSGASGGTVTGDSKTKSYTYTKSSINDTHSYELTGKTEINGSTYYTGAKKTGSSNYSASSLTWS